MFYKADLHTHSHFAGATSKNLCLETLYQWALIKGIDVVGTGDFTHPAWMNELQQKLQPAGNGFYTLKQLPLLTELPGIRTSYRKVYFCLSTEVSCEYYINGRKYRTHHLLYAGDFSTAQLINKELSKYSNLSSDGRPTLTLKEHELLKIVLNISGAYLVPAHVWTPWCSTLGAMEGHNTLRACFKDVTHELFAVETSLSADPLMCRRYDEFNDLTLLSNSYAHSARNLGREVNLLNTEMSYDDMFNAFKTRQGFAGTYELFPQKGKCYNTGHRNCNVSLSTDDIQDTICPVCNKPLTIGVSLRVEQLSNQIACEAEAYSHPFQYILPLPEVFAELLHIKAETPVKTAAVANAYTKAISHFGNEFDILHETPLEDIRRYHHKLSMAIERLRNNQKHVTAGYDGIYGNIRFFDDSELNVKQQQLALF